jgi:hypothetical protein
MLVAALVPEVLVKALEMVVQPQQIQEVVDLQEMLNPRQLVAPVVLA